jgi:hypothetical protein
MRKSYGGTPSSGQKIELINQIINLLTPNKVKVPFHKAKSVEDEIFN